MLRLTELKLPLDHAAPDLAAAVAARVAPAALRRFSVFRRGYDARRKPIQLIYTIDAEVDDEAVTVAPAVAAPRRPGYRFVTLRAPAGLTDPPRWSSGPGLAGCLPG